MSGFIVIYYNWFISSKAATAARKDREGRCVYSANKVIYLISKIGSRLKTV